MVQNIGLVKSVGEEKRLDSNNIYLWVLECLIRAGQVSPVDQVAGFQVSRDSPEFSPKDNLRLN